MKAKTIVNNKKQNTCSFEIDDIDSSFVNAIRRCVVEEVPTLAVEDCEIRENSSALYDEMLALRLGLTPIKTDLSSYSLPENEDEITEKSAKCTLQIHLKANKKGYVYASEAKSSDPKCTFVYPQMPIVKINSKQKIDVVMTAVVGQGKDHIKWAPGTVWFNNKAKITVKNNAKLLEDNKQKYPAQIFDSKGQISEKKIQELGLVDAVAGVCPELVDVEYVENSFIMNVEGWGQLSCTEMLTTAANILAQKAKELEALI
jgi:DNA-directed RNA polymerase subunit D